MSTNRRNTYVGDRRVLFAYRCIWTLASLNLILFLVFGNFAWQAIAAGEPTAIGMGGLYALGIVTTLLTFTALGLGVYSVVHSHRLLGAAYRIQASIREVKDACRDNPRPVPSVKLREGDHLEPLAREVNELVTQLSGT